MSSTFVRIRKNLKKLFILTLAVAVISGSGAANFIKNKSAEASSPVNVWWPAENSHVTGVQPFKALLQGYDLNSYTMDWQVDGGQLNSMVNNYTDYPHKQADVDLTGWNWKGSGPYALTFIAKDLSGNIVGQQTSTIYIGAGTTPTQVQSAPAILAAANAITPAVITAGNTGTTGTAQLNNWWPTEGSNLSGVQPFKADVSGLAVTSYNMTWQVDGGRTNAMQTNYTDAPHKQADVDVSSWNWKGSGPYTLTFTATDSSGRTIATKNININIGGGATSPSQPTLNSSAATSSILQNSTLQTPTAATLLNTTLIAPNGSSPFAGQKLWVDPSSDAANYARRPDISSSDRQLMQKVAAGAETQWFSTDWISNMNQAVHNYVSTARAAGAMPTMVLYNIPLRDCGQYSAGGANDPNVYKQTVDQFAAGIGSAKAAVIIEPDALTLTDCLSASQLSQRFDLLQYAVQKFASLGNTATYLDIGHPGWKTPQDAANLLASAGVRGANGFSLNVSNFNTDQENIDYGTQITNALAAKGISGKHFVIDTGRNGNGSNGQWCNPSGRALGQLPGANTGNPLVDAFLWVKGPGGSDGACNGGPAAGQFWPQYALGLAQAAHW